MPVTGVALIAAAVLHVVVSVLVSLDLPDAVPIAFDLTGRPVAATSPATVLLLVVAVPLVLAGGAALVGQRWRPPRGDRVRHLAAVTLLFLTFEVATVYGALGGVATAAWTGEGDSYASASLAVEGFQRSGGRLPTAALVVLGLYLAYLVTWAAVVRRGDR